MKTFSDHLYRKFIFFKNSYNHYWTLLLLVTPTLCHGTLALAWQLMTLTTSLTLGHGLGPSGLVIDWLTEHDLTSPPTQYRLSGRRFYRSENPTNSIKVLKEHKESIQK